MASPFSNDANEDIRILEHRREALVTGALSGPGVDAMLVAIDHVIDRLKAEDESSAD